MINSGIDLRQILRPKRVRKADQNDAQTHEKSNVNFNMKKETKSLLSQISRKFCESTSLHGYSYIANGNSVALKIFWSTIIVCLTGIGIKFLIVNTQDYMESRLVTGIDSSSAPLNVS